MIFVDTNIIVRVIVQDNPTQTKKAVQFIEQVRDKKIEAFVEDSVIAEVVWVTRSPKLYGLTRSEISGKLIAILTLENMNLDYKPEVLEALKIYSETNLDFVDCLALSYQRSGVVQEIMTFDRALKRKGSSEEKRKN